MLPDSNTEWSLAKVLHRFSIIFKTVLIKFQEVRL